MDPLRVYQTDSNLLYLPALLVYAEYNEDFGCYLYPAGTRVKAPPVLKENEAARSLGLDLNDDWEVVADFRGLTYWLADRTCTTITEVGITPPTGYLTADPGPTPAQATKELAVQALADSQNVLMGCYEAGIPFPSAWRAYRTALKAIVAGNGATTLPTAPAMPDGI